ncbi:MAG: hypothetical protein EBT83_16395 [Betaproteobacteria bacterium]|nr:hypothetical protein [Betaproteobacteria bacterium]
MIYATDFELRETGTASGFVSGIQALRPVNGVASEYDLTISGITGQGNLVLELKSSGTGIQDAVSDTFQALFAPAGAPPEVVAKLAKEAIAVLAQKEVKDALWTAGLKVTAGGPDALRARIAQEVPMWRDVIEKAGIKAE